MIEYRILGENEIIQEGDEWSNYLNVWRKHKGWNNKKVLMLKEAVGKEGRVRREIKSIKCNCDIFKMWNFQRTVV